MTRLQSSCDQADLDYNVMFELAFESEDVFNKVLCKPTEARFYVSSMAGYDAPFVYSGKLKLERHGLGVFIVRD